VRKAGLCPKGTRLTVYGADLAPENCDRDIPIIGHLSPGHPSFRGFLCGRRAVFLVLSGFLIGGILPDACDCSNYRVFDTRKFSALFRYMRFVSVPRFYSFPWQGAYTLAGKAQLGQPNVWIATQNTFGQAGISVTCQQNTQSELQDSSICSQKFKPAQELLPRHREAEDHLDKA
jgi:hypothetical protein